MKKIFNIILLILITGFYSCNKDNSNKCIENRISYVTNVDALKTGLINKPVQVEVQFGVSNGCGQFGKFLESSNGNTRTIEVEAKYIGCICTQDIPIRNTQYEFLTSEPGVYRLMFKSGKSNFIEIDIEITE